MANRASTRDACDQRPPLERQGPNFSLPTQAMFCFCSPMIQYRGDQTTGFQSPAQDYVEGVVDLAGMLDLRRPNRYPVRVKGQALRERGIHHGDILIADAAAEPRSGKGLRRHDRRRRGSGHPRAAR